MSTIITNWKAYVILQWIIVCIALYAFLHDVDAIVLFCIAINAVITVRRQQLANLHFKSIGDVNRVDLFSVLIGVLIVIISIYYGLIELYKLFN